MADTVKVPAIGPVKKQWLIAGGGLVVGIVGWAYWQRSRPSQAELNAAADPATAGDAIPEDRIPPPTVVGSQDFDTQGASAIINTNTEWYTAAVEYLSGQGGYDFIFVTTTLGKFLARRELTQSEANLVQAAKGVVGEPPQGGPWPIILAQPATGSTSTNKLKAPALRYSAGSLANTLYALYWTRVTGAAYYIVQRTSGPGAPTSIAVIGTKRVTPPLKRGSTYSYRVKAVSRTPGVASSDWSNTVKFTVPKTYRKAS